MSAIFKVLVVLSSTAVARASVVAGKKRDHRQISGGDAGGSAQNNDGGVLKYVRRNGRFPPSAPTHAPPQFFGEHSGEWTARDGSTPSALPLQTHQPGMGFSPGGRFDQRRNAITMDELRLSIEGHTFPPSTSAAPAQHSPRKATQDATFQGFVGDFGPLDVFPPEQQPVTSSHAQASVDQDQIHDLMIAEIQPGAPLRESDWQKGLCSDYSDYSQLRGAPPSVASTMADSASQHGYRFHRKDGFQQGGGFDWRKHVSGWRNFPLMIEDGPKPESQQRDDDKTRVGSSSTAFSVPPASSSSRISTHMASVRQGVGDDDAMDMQERNPSSDLELGGEGDDNGSLEPLRDGNLMGGDGQLDSETLDILGSMVPEPMTMPRRPSGVAIEQFFQTPGSTDPWPRRPSQVVIEQFFDGRNFVGSNNPGGATERHRKGVTSMVSS